MPTLTDQLLGRTVELMKGATLDATTPFVCLFHQGQWRMLTWGLFQQSITVRS